MSEDSLKNIPLSELHELMVLSIDELLAMYKSNDSLNEIGDKQKQIELLQKIIYAKKAELQHG